MWLIDGHNLIGQLQDLSLDDPHDEAKITMAIKRYCMRANCQATVIFDNGLPGGFSKELSNNSVKVYFAPPRTKADHILMQRAKEMHHLPNFILVTSDRQIARLAYAYGIETMSSEEFALLLGFRPVELPPEAPDKPKRIKIVYEKDPNPHISPQEVAYWLPIFEQRLREARLAKRAAEQAERERIRAERLARKQAAEEERLRKKKRLS